MTVVAAQVDYERLANQALRMLQAGQFSSALAIYDELLQKFPNYIDGWYNKGITLTKHFNRHADAVDCFNRGLQINPSDIDMWHWRGKSLLALTRNQEALESFERVIQLRPNYRIAIEGKAAALYAMGLYEESILICDQLLAMYPPGHPKTAQALLTKSMCLNNTAKYKQTIVFVNKALAINPQSDELWEIKGAALGGMAKYKEALSCLEEALRLNPKNQTAQATLSQIREVLEDHYG